MCERCNDKRCKCEKEKDGAINIERVANGYIVTPRGRDPYFSGQPVFDSVFAFETFDSLLKWLDGHFTKPEQK